MATNNGYNSDGSGAWGDPRVLSTWQPGMPVPGVARSLRSFYDVAFPAPDLAPKKLPYYPDEPNGVHVPRLGEVLVEANKHLMPSQYMPDTYDALKAKAQAAAGYAQGVKVASSPPTEVPDARTNG